MVISHVEECINGRNLGKQIAHPYFLSMLIEESPPTRLGRAVIRFAHVFRHASGTDGKTEPHQLRLDPALIPQWVLTRHATDQCR